MRCATSPPAPASDRVSPSDLAKLSETPRSNGTRSLWGLALASSAWCSSTRSARGNERSSRSSKSSPMAQRALRRGRGFAQMAHGWSHRRSMIRHRTDISSQAGPGHVDSSTQGHVSTVGSLQRAQYPLLSPSTRFQAVCMDFWCQVSSIACQCPDLPADLRKP